MTKQGKQFFYALVLLAATTAMTACNRGYGCPTDLSVAVEQPSVCE